MPRASTPGCARSSRRAVFPGDDAATKLIWLALRTITADSGRAAKEWKEAINSLRSSTRIDSQRQLRNMRHRLAHRVGRSSQATTAAVDKPHSASYTKLLTLLFDPEAHPFQV